MNIRKKLQAAALLLVVTAVVYAKVTGPDPGYTNAPNDIGNCTFCHDTNTLNSGTGTVTVSGGPIGGVYEPGQQYTLTITVQQNKRQRYGFQMTALDGTNHRAGTLASLNGDTQVLSQTGFGGRQYIEHTQQGTTPNGPNSRIWQVRWTAPDTDVGTVFFYIAANAANGDGTNQGDFIYATKFITDSESSHVTLSLQTQLDGQIMQPDQQVPINWATTAQSNIDNIEVRYSTDDGVTFPVQPGQIFFTRDGTVTGFTWTVPDVKTTVGRIRITVGTKSGTPVPAVITGRFTINGSGAPSPEIGSASITGKQLFVNGQNFAQGALLFMCDSCATPVTQGDKVKKTVNDTLTPTMLLIAKKAGKTIASGQTVQLQIQNPDGSVSNTFSFTRP